MPALDISGFEAAMAGGAIPLDLRSPAHFAQGHIPGSIFLQFGSQDLVDRAELYLPRNLTYLLMMDPAPLGPVAEKLLAAGDYRVAGFLQGGLKTWIGLGRPLRTIPTISVADLHERYTRGEHVNLVDVREDFEFAWGHVDIAQNFPNTEIWQRWGELDGSRHWHVICNDQQRSGATASVLCRQGFTQVTMVLGGTLAWMEAGYALTKTA